MTYKDFTPGQLAAYFDHTQLKASAMERDFEILCEESKKYGFKMVAINPAPVMLCKKLLAGTAVHVGAAISFPLGQTPIEAKCFETQTAIRQGADEIDYVVNLTMLKEKKYDYVEKEMAEIVACCREHQVISKVIFENCYLELEDKKALCAIAKEVGPDFVKTSTGFGCGGATVEDMALMKSLVGDKVKVKAAGGIRTLDTAIEMINAGAERIGSTASVKIVEELMARL